MALLLQSMDQSVTEMFKAFYLLIHETDREDKQAAVREFWRSYTIMKGVNNIEASWDEVTQANMNAVWRMWPECVRDFPGFAT